MRVLWAASEGPALVKNTLNVQKASLLALLCARAHYGIACAFSFNTYQVDALLG